MRHSSHRDELVARIEASRKVISTAAGAVSGDPELLQLASRLDAGTQRLADFTAFATRDVSSQNFIKFFQPQDTKDKGIINIASAQLDKNQVLMVGSIILMAATSTTAISGSRSTLAALNYGAIDSVAGLVSGEITMRYHGKNVLDKLPIQRFVTSGDHRTQIGEFVLDNPILIRENDGFELNIETGIALPDRTALRVLLVGTGVVNN